MIVYAAHHMVLCMCMYVANSRPLYMCVFLGTAAPLPNSVGITAVKLLSGDVEVHCSIPVTNCLELVLVRSINSPEQLYVRLINSTDERRTVFSVDLIGITPQPL